jgi:hypothetical protein
MRWQSPDPEVGEGWVIPWFEAPQPGVVRDVQLVREPPEK